MYGSSHKKLYDIPSMPDSMMAKKFTSRTDTYYDPSTVSNFMKEALRDRGTDAPIFEHELPRKDNLQRNLILQLHSSGTPYSHDPYHPELFLGDLTKDTRGVYNEPDRNEMRKQSKFRHDKYIAGKLQDDPDTRVEGTASAKAINRATYSGFARTASRMTNLFDDSVDTGVRKSNPNPGRTIQNTNDTIKEDQKYHQSTSEKINPNMGYNPVSFLSNQVGAQWLQQPDNKFGLSSVSNVYRNKGEVDAATNAAFRQGMQETEVGESQMNLTMTAMKKTKDAAKLSKDISMQSEVSLKSDSRKDTLLNRMILPSKHVGGNAVNTTHFTQKKMKDQFQSKAYGVKPQNGNKQEKLGVMEPVKLTPQMYGTINARGVPKKDQMQIMKSVRRDGKQNRLGAEGFAQRYKTNTKNLTKAFTKRQESYYEAASVHASKRPQEAFLYKNAELHKPEDRVSNVRRTKNKFQGPTEQVNKKVIGAGQTKEIPTINVGNYEFDMDPDADNKYMTKRNSIQKMGYIFNQRIYDNDVSPLSEITGMRKYMDTENVVKV